jgi:hypothetical protein
MLAVMDSVQTADLHFQGLYRKCDIKLKEASYQVVPESCLPKGNWTGDYYY